MKKKLIALVAAVVAVVPFAPGTAQAQAGAKVSFQCTAHLSAFPSPGASGQCKGRIRAAGIGVGFGGGVSSSGDAYVFVGAGDFLASFNYAEACVANEPPAIGTATGTASITNWPAVHKGELTTASATLDFSWTRVGLTAVITVSNVQLSFANGGTDNPIIGAATAGFAPILGPANTCPSGGPLEAEVAGEAVLGG